jgi:PadR family transcriptional regulator AphA
MSPRHKASNSFEQIILGTMYQHPMHGYELYKEISRLEGVGLVWRIKQSLLYALLDGMEGMGLLHSTLIPGENRPPRKEYQLTDKGQTAFFDWVETPVGHGRDMRQDFLARFYFARKLGNQVTERLLTRQKDACQVWLLNLHSEIEKLESDQEYDRLVFQFRVQQTEAMISWLDYCSAICQSNVPLIQSG